MSKNKLISFPWSNPKEYNSAGEYARIEMERVFEWIVEYLDRQNQLPTEFALDSDLTSLTARVVTLEAEVASLNAHPSDTTTHGTVSDIVGESDVQSLDNKQIGDSNPGRVGATVMTLQNSLTANYTVPAGRTMVVPTDFTVIADLTLTGDLQVI